MQRITFLGTGTSQGIPVISCGCWVCASNDGRDKRLRSSAMIESGSTRIIIDAGMDFRQQMLRENIRHVDGILLTHLHKDHIGGLDEVRAFNYVSRQAVDIYATEATQAVVRKDYDYAFDARHYPGAPEISLHTISGEEPFRVGDTEVIPINGMHASMPVLGFRVGGIGYITDFNYISDAEIEKLKGVEYFAINAPMKEPHFSHFSLDQALHIAYLVGARKSFITHISHRMGRHALINPQFPDYAELAYDGLKLEIR